MSQDKAPDCHIQIDGNLYPAADQPPHPELQAAFKATAKGKISVHMPTAKIVARDIIRGVRGEKFKAVDDERNQALDDDDATRRAAVKAKAQKLRDAPADPRIDAAKTPDELFAAIEAIKADL